MQYAHWCWEVGMFSSGYSMDIFQCLNDRIHGKNAILSILNYAEFAGDDNEFQLQKLQSDFKNNADCNRSKSFLSPPFVWFRKSLSWHTALRIRRKSEKREKESRKDSKMENGYRKSQDGLANKVSVKVEWRTRFVSCLS